ncbi:hypothetical protein [Serratia sp. M24T3]|uniref:hypothetical protein n=1 Tax=Serratia sp. M24T3 TaxID=932213 RepID=UPI00025BBA72|nr:hypothetical protein [Serratia sp. M24T3]EIC83373.1 hypothetical protein SPM24T3_17220 [Serratia sp. M24T3]
MGSKKRGRRGESGKNRKRRPNSPPGNRPENEVPEEEKKSDDSIQSKWEKLKDFAGKGKDTYDKLSAVNDIGVNYERLLAGMRTRGVSEPQIKQAQDDVFNNYIPGTSRLDRMSILADAQKTFNPGLTKDKSLQAAEMMVPILSRYDVASKLSDDAYDASKDDNRNTINDLVSSMDALNNPERATEIVDSVFKYTQGTGQTIDEKKTEAFLANKSVASHNQNLHALFSVLEPVISDLGGDETASGLQKASDFINGKKPLLPNSRREILRLGIGNAQGTGQSPSLHALQNSDVSSYTQQLKTIYQAHGINSSADMQRENGILFGRAGAKVYNQIMDAIDKTQPSYDSAMSVKSVVDNPANQLLLAKDQVEKAKADVQLSAAEKTGIMPIFKKINQGQAKASEYAANFIDKHPLLDKVGLGGYLAYQVPGVKSWLEKKALALGGPLKRTGGYLGRMAIDVAKNKLPALGRAALPILEDVALPFVADIAAPALVVAGVGYAGHSVTQSEEMAELDRVKRRNWALNNPKLPYYNGDVNLKDLSPKPGISPLSQLPEVPSASQQPITIQVNSILDGKKVGEGTATYLAREAAKPRNSVSGYDASLYGILPGSVSKLTTN